MSTAGSLGSGAVLDTAAGSVQFHRIARVFELGLGEVDRLPVSLKVLLEGLLRRADAGLDNEADVAAVAGWPGSIESGRAVPFRPDRLILQDFTGIPALIGLAAMRTALHRSGGDPALVDPVVPTVLVMDHSLQVDVAGTPDALSVNLAMEYERNAERYRFARWAEQAFANLRVVPPGKGIVHQVNMEFLASVVTVSGGDSGPVAHPDTLVGTDSHTTMVNAMGVLGWGVGGIEAEAVMLGEPIPVVVPEVVGVRLAGAPQPGVTGTDLVLAITRMLRAFGVVGAFVEFCGPGVNSLPLPDRATIANMAPEYGATVGYFAVDNETLRYLRGTGRRPDHIDLVERYCRTQGMFRTPGSPEPAFTRTLDIDLAAIEPVVAGPHRPHQTQTLAEVPASFRQALAEHRGPNAPPKQTATQRDLPFLAAFDAGDPDAQPKGTDAKRDAPGTALRRRALPDAPPKRTDAQRDLSFLSAFDAGDPDAQPKTTDPRRDGDVAIAAITSCTNTSNPAVMIGAGLLARNAVERGLSVPAHVKTSLAPGSPVVADYLERLGLLPYLEKLGFAIVGYGCTTCAGGSGPLAAPVAAAAERDDLVLAAVLSGNRNFEGRIHPQCRLAYLASPPLVVAYALAGTVDVDISTEPLAIDPDGAPVLLADLWPDDAEIADLAASAADPTLFDARRDEIFAGDERWQSLVGEAGVLHDWDPASTYVQTPPFAQSVAPEPPPLDDITAARCLLLLGDQTTTDHISPAGAIAPDSPAGQYLIGRGVAPADFSVLGARRGNHEVMVRGTFANPRLRNLLTPDREGAWTVHHPTGEVTTVFEASQQYRTAGTPLIVLAGTDYGAGSSRDWAAKGTALLGVRAVVASSFERLHRLNLIHMGVLPLQFESGTGWQQTGLTGTEVFYVAGMETGIAPGATLTLRATAAQGATRDIPVTVRLDSHAEAAYYRHGGIVPFVLRRLQRPSG